MLHIYKYFYTVAEWNERKTKFLRKLILVFISKFIPCIWNTVKLRYNALQGTEPGERYKRDSAISVISLFTVFFLVFSEKKKKTVKRLKYRLNLDKSIEEWLNHFSTLLTLFSINSSNFHFFSPFFPPTSLSFNISETVNFFTKSE